MIQLPIELTRKIMYMYIPLYMAKMNDVHHELLNHDIYLHLTEHIYDFELDFHYAIRIPKLESSYELYI